MDKVIIYNPPSGSKIEHFIFADKGEFPPHDVGELKYYDEPEATELLKTFAFLQELTPAQAIELKNLVKCEKCSVTFKPEAKSAIETHMKMAHEEVKKEAVVVEGIPEAIATPVEANRSLAQRAEEDLTSAPEFYGPGLVDERKGIKPRNLYN